MLLQSWGNKIRIFPGVSGKWNDVVFHNLRAEGGFEVSAKKQNGKTVWIRVKNNAGEPCIIEPGFGSEFKVMGGKAKKTKPGTYSLTIEKGKEIILYLNDTDNFIVDPIIAENEEYNVYGLRNN